MGLAGRIPKNRVRIINFDNSVNMRIGKVGISLKKSKMSPVGENLQKNGKGSRKFSPWHGNGNLMFYYFGRWIGSAVRVAGKLSNI